MSFKLVSRHEHLLAALFSFSSAVHWRGCGAQAESLDRMWSSCDLIGSHSGIS